MSNQTSDAERLAIITASVSAFFFIVSWILYGTAKLIGDGTDDWRPMGYAAIAHITSKCLSRENAGDDAGPADETTESETSEPENEEFEECYSGTEFANKFD
jgi:hypothetical protein